MNKIYIVRVDQESPKIDTIVFSSDDRRKCIAFFLESEYNNCYLEEWLGTTVLVRNVLVK